MCVHIEDCSCIFVIQLLCEVTSSAELVARLVATAQGKNANAFLLPPIPDVDQFTIVMMFSSFS